MDCEKIDDSWVGRFLDRHRDTLQMHWSRPLDMQRAQSMNLEAKKKWFELLEEFIMKVGVRPEDVYGMRLAVCHWTRVQSVFVGAEVQKPSINKVEPTVKM